MSCVFDLDTLVAHFRRLAPVAKFVSHSAHGAGRYGPHGFGDRLEPALNVCYGQMSDLGVVLGAYYSGPHSLTTPLGTFRIEASMLGHECRGWIEKVDARLGLKPLYGEMKNGKWDSIRSEYGEHGPGWSVLRDMDGQPFEEPKTKILSWFTGPSTECLIEYEEARLLWDRVRKEVYESERL